MYNNKVLILHLEKVRNLFLKGFPSVACLQRNFAICIAHEF